MVKKKAAPKKGTNKKVDGGGEGGGSDAGVAGVAPAPATANGILCEGGETGAAGSNAPASGVAPAATAPVPPAVPAPAKPSVPPRRAAALAVTEAFAIHPFDRLYVTSDDQVFGVESHANNHARTLEAKEVKVISRKDWK